MKPLTPHDPLDDLIAAALHGDLTPEERAQFDARLSNDPAAQAAYQEAQAMHDLLEKTHQSAQPDPAFEQRMVSGVRRKLQHEEKRETAWESLVALWRGVKRLFAIKRKATIPWGSTLTVLFIIAILVGVALGPITNGTKQAQASALMQLAHQQSLADAQIQLNAGKVAQGMVSGAMPAPAAANEFDGDGAFGRSTKVILRNTPSLDAPMAPVAAPALPPYPGALASKSLDVVDDLQAKDKSTQRQVADSDISSPLPPVASQQPEAAVLKNPVAPAESAPVIDTRKLIRNAQLDLEVKSFQTAMDQITALTKAAGGYVDTSNSQKGGNGKLQGTVVVKVLPQNLDSFLLKLRELGRLDNQSVSTDDVTKDYFDTQARLDNSRRMETQLQDLLKHANSKVSDLLQVERELGRVRGEIEQMQGQLKLYDFQVQYATVTMQVHEKDLNQTAAYLLKEQDDFSLFATDVEGTFQKARHAADDFKGQILAANLNHNSGSDVSAELVVMVAPDQIEAFLKQIRSLGRVSNFTRQTQRVAKDGGNSDNPADQTLTEKDKVQVHLAIRSDDETRKQVALTVVAKAVDDALDQAKTAALANAGVEILSSSLNKTAQGQSTAQLSVRVPGGEYSTVIAAFEALGRTDSLNIQRNDNSGPGANGDDAPVIVSLALTDDDAPLQQTDMSVLGTDVDGEAQQIKKDAAAAGVEVKASSFQRQPDGTELAQMTFRLPMAKYPPFVERLKQLGKVESLSVRRDDRPDETRTDENAPVEITLRLHNQGDIVPDDGGLWATLRQTFGDGAGALFSSVRTIGVMMAFVAPWAIMLVLFAWIGRRIYIWRRK